MTSEPEVANRPAPMPAYRAHKVVHALKIRAVSGDIITPEELGFAPFTVEPGWVARHSPQPGGYYVEYEDGYRSYSPAVPFETGYARIVPGSPTPQEPKYTTDAIGRFINRSTGKPIPEDEPVILFRAQDRKALSALRSYHTSCEQADHRAVIGARIRAFEKFAEEHPERMKEPDSNMRELSAIDMSGTFQPPKAVQEPTGDLNVNTTPTSDLPAETTPTPTGGDLASDLQA